MIPKKQFSLQRQAILEDVTMEKKMFCYQCQETAGCKGCMVSGVCGKKP